MFIQVLDLGLCSKCIGFYFISVFLSIKRSEVKRSVKKFKLSYKHIPSATWMIICIVIAWSSVSFLISNIYNPMLRPNFMIRNHILRHTPIGMCIEEAIEVIENNESWGIPEINRNRGFLHRNPWAYDVPFGELIIGDKRIQSRPEMQNVLFFFERHLQIFWGFDEGGKLIEVHVHEDLTPRLS